MNIPKILIWLSAMPGKFAIVSRAYRTHWAALFTATRRVTTKRKGI